MGTRRTHSAEFKQQAVELTRQPGNTVAGVARDLGVGRSTLTRWIRAAKQDG